jgi:deoxyribodipyrimidine photo-lyase
VSVAIWWVRRDLRLADNPALHAAAGVGAVLPVFVIDSAVMEGRHHRNAEARRAFLAGGLRALDADLARHGLRLHVARGRPPEVLRELLQRTGAQAVFAEQDFTPGARARDAAVARELPLRLMPGLCVHHPAQVLSAAQAPYTVFTPFYRAWRALPPPDAGICLPVPTLRPVAAFAAVEPEVPAASPLMVPGEAEARRRLQRFVADGLHRYHLHRDLLAIDGTSTLSPYLRFGMLSPRVAAVAALAAMHARPDDARGAETWLKELAWREFYIGVLHHFPQVTRMAFNPRLRAIGWRDAPADLAAWQQGQTGYPIVDACMRQLRATGWMHNRGRMIVASFLCKDLLIDWRRGEQWFMQHLLDGDIAANNGGWQWTAGVGTDAAPYFRIFNPVLQGEKFDPDGDFVRRWVPELAALAAGDIHRPWELPPLAREAAGLSGDGCYPAPLVDRAIVKARTLAAYRAAREEDAAPQA